MPDETFDPLIGIRDICRYENKSRSTIYAWVEKGLFPPPLPNPTGRSPNQWLSSTYRAYRKQRYGEAA